MKRTQEILKRIFSLNNFLILSMLFVCILYVNGADVFKLINFGADKITVTLFSIIAIELFISKTIFEKDLQKDIAEIKKHIGNVGNTQLIKASDLDRIESIVAEARKELCFLGITLEAVGAISTTLEKKISEGCQIKFLALDPDGKYIAASSAMSNVNCEIRKTKIKSSLSDLKALFKEEIASGKVEIKVIDSVIPIGIIGLDIDASKGKLIIQHYLYQKRASYSPNIIISNNTDSYWYKIYKEQWDEMWKNARIFN